MGAEAWSYFTPFEASIEAALARLRKRVFDSGDYRGSEAKPATPEETVENMDADGTASILDITAVSDSPDFCSVCHLTDERLTSLFDTTQPTHDMIEANMEFYDEIERGQGIYIKVFRDGIPDEYFFAGYSFD